MAEYEMPIAQGFDEVTVIRRRMAEDFHVGQKVMVKDADIFIWEVANYVRGRVGTVIKVWPSNTPRDSLMRKNQLSIKWDKRNGRGKEKVMVMHPQYLLPANDEINGNLPNEQTETKGEEVKA